MWTYGPPPASAPVTSSVGRTILIFAGFPPTAVNVYVPGPTLLRTPAGPVTGWGPPGVVSTPAGVPLTTKARVVGVKFEFANGVVNVYCFWGAAKSCKITGAPLTPAPLVLALPPIVDLGAPIGPSRSVL